MPRNAHFRVAFSGLPGCQNHSYENELRLWVHFHANQTHFLKKGFCTKTWRETESQGNLENGLLDWWKTIIISSYGQQYLFISSTISVHMINNICSYGQQYQFIWLTISVHGVNNFKVWLLLFKKIICIYVLVLWIKNN